MPESENNNKESFFEKIIELFLKGDLAPFLIAFSLLAGAAAIMLTPREEEPQIIVPIADVFIHANGLTASEIERQISTRLEKILTQIDGVEHVYSISRSGNAIVTVRFHVGEDREESLVKLYNKLYSNIDLVHPDITNWVVKPIEIDDVPIVNVTLWSDSPHTIDDYALYRIAEELEIKFQALPNTNRTEIYGGRPRQVRVELDFDALAARQTSSLDVLWALGVSNQREVVGDFDKSDKNINVQTGEFFADAESVKRTVVNVVDGIPVFLGDVSKVMDGPAEYSSYTWMGFGPASEFSLTDMDQDALYPAVNIAIAKKKGSNAIWVSDSIEQELKAFERNHFPDNVYATVTRNYGKTANDKVNELLEALVIAIIIVIGLIAYSLGWREGLVVASAVPITFALTLIINYAAGYTINRVTLFALILSLGLVVDDPIVDVENIYRHLRMKSDSAMAAVKRAMVEVMQPIVLSTLAVIVAFLPLFLITGMMGPYMRPMALNVPVAMIMSTLVAFTITPWLTLKALKNHVAPVEKSEVTNEHESFMYRFYAKLLVPLLDNTTRAWQVLAITFLLFVLAISLVAFRAVPLKLLPFDNKNELQIVVDTKEGTTLEKTNAIVTDIGKYLATIPEVKNFQIYTGISSPMDFNGLVRHYFLRKGSNVADIRVNLVDKRKRRSQSHEIALRIRDDIERIVRSEDARVAIVESPPGPPVISTITAEVYGDAGTSYQQIQQAAYKLAERLGQEPGVSDIDTSTEDDSYKWVFEIDQEKAALSGVSMEDIRLSVSLALSGTVATRMHLAEEVSPVSILLHSSRSERSSLDFLKTIPIKGRPGIAKVSDNQVTRDAPVPVVRLGELGSFTKALVDKSILHKDLQPIAYVYAEAVGRAPAEIVADVNADFMEANFASESIDERNASRSLSKRSYFNNGGGLAWTLPDNIIVKWFGEGELKITKDVFRDLGIGFSIALIGIYFILVYQTRSYAMPLILMISIPLTIIGIMPGFWILNIITGEQISGYQNPTFFTATAMIGMIALAGIAVRNAILLIEFLHVGLKKGLKLKEAIIEAGAIRTRPILLTAGTAMLAAIPITLDPVFSGLAWALIFGLLVSTTFTLVVVPITYFLVYRNKPHHGLPQ